MKRFVVPFLCGAAVGGAAASAAWGLLGATPEEPAPEPAPPPAVSAPAPSPDTVVRPEPRRRRPAPPPAPAETEAEPALATAPAAPQAPAAPAPEARRDESREDRPPRPRWPQTEEEREEMRQRFRRFQEERSAQMISRFVERNGLSEEDGAAVLAVADDFGDRARESLARCRDWLELSGRDRLPRDQSARVLSEFFGGLADAYDELAATYGEGILTDTEADLDLGQLIDPEIWGQLFRIGSGGGPRGPGGFFGGRRGGGRRGGGGPGGGNGGGNSPGG